MTTQVLPPYFWHDEKNHKRYINWLAIELQIKNVDDWYKISGKEFRSHRGTGLLKLYDNSHIRLITSLVSNPRWHVWKFGKTITRFWDKKENRITYLKWLESELGYEKPDDWYKTSILDFKNNYGSRIVVSKTIIEVVAELYPQRDWLPWKFSFVPKGFWHIKSNRLTYMNWLGKQLGYSKRTDWYKLSTEAFDGHDGYAMFHSIYSCIPYHAVSDVSLITHGNRGCLIQSLRGIGTKRKIEWRISNG